jgi:short subunit dehydrogenase-like uncharacterized protein
MTPVAKDPRRIMIYGANGFTGRLIAQEAVRRGQRPILAGRNTAALDALAAELQCQVRVFKVDAGDDILRYLADCFAVLNCAGPFSATAVPLIDACLAVGTHYLDVTGEIDVVEAAAERGARAASRGVALIPAAGFDVVPIDCLAARVARELPSATRLLIAVKAAEPKSAGTNKTIIQSVSRGAARSGGALVQVPVAWKGRRIPFPSGAAWAMTVPLADVSTSWYSTKIPNIEVYAALPRPAFWLIRAARRLLRLADQPHVQRWLQRWAERRRLSIAGDAFQRAKAEIWVRAEDDGGAFVEATLVTPGGYALTVLAALGVLERIQQQPCAGGFYTPSQACGAEFILELPGIAAPVFTRSGTPVDEKQKHTKI